MLRDDQSKLQRAFRHLHLLLFSSYLRDNLLRAFLREHSEAGTFVAQHIAAGAYSHRLAQIYENYFGDDK